MRNLILLIFLICGPATVAVAYTSSISAGTGNAGRGVSEPVENPYLNPAALAYQKGYYFGMGFARLNTEVYGQQDLVTLALTDNMPDTVLPTSIAYTEAKSPDLGKEGIRRDFRLGVGNFYTKPVALGLALNYRTSKTPEFSKQQLNASIGAMFPIHQNLGFGLIFENIVPTDTTLPESERLDPNVAFGVSYNYLKFVRLRADVISQAGNSFAKPIFAGGIENYWNRWLIFRLGAQRDLGKDSSMETIGLGFAGPKFELQYAFQAIHALKESDNRHSIDLGLPIW